MTEFITDCIKITAVCMVVAFPIGYSGAGIEYDPQVRRIEAVYKLNQEYVATHPWLAKRLRETR